jgi:hypothetical protein
MATAAVEETITLLPQNKGGKEAEQKAEASNTVKHQPLTTRNKLSIAMAVIIGGGTLLACAGLLFWQLISLFASLDPLSALLMFSPLFSIIFIAWAFWRAKRKDNQNMHAFYSSLASRLANHLATKSWLAQKIDMSFLSSESAGRTAVWARIVRCLAVIANLSLCAVLLAHGDLSALNRLIDIGNTFFLIYMGNVVLTWIGIALGFNANIAKIEQFHATECEIITEINALIKERKSQGKSTADNILNYIPHTVSQMWQHQDLFWSVKVLRKAHDLNSILGSVLNLLRFWTTMALPFIGVLSIAGVVSFPPALIGLFVASSVLSALGNLLTNSGWLTFGRLAAHLRLVKNLQHGHLFLLNATQENKTDDALDSIIKPIKKTIEDATDHREYQTNIQYYVQRTLTEHKGLIRESNQEKLTQSLNDFINSLTTQPANKQQPGFWARHSARIINSDKQGVRLSLRNILRDRFGIKQTVSTLEGAAIVGDYVLMLLLAQKYADGNIDKIKSVYKTLFNTVGETKTETTAMSPHEQHYHAMALLKMESIIFNDKQAH